MASGNEHVLAHLDGNDPHHPEQSK